MDEPACPAHQLASVVRCVDDLLGSTRSTWIHSLAQLTRRVRLLDSHTLCFPNSCAGIWFLRRNPCKNLTVLLTRFSSSFALRDGPSHYSFCCYTSKALSAMSASSANDLNALETALEAQKDKAQQAQKIAESEIAKKKVLEATIAFEKANKEDAEATAIIQTFLAGNSAVNTTPGGSGGASAAGDLQAVKAEATTAGGSGGASAVPVPVGVIDLSGEDGSGGAAAPTAGRSGGASAAAPPVGVIDLSGEDSDGAAEAVADSDCGDGGAAAAQQSVADAAADGAAAAQQSVAEAAADGAAVAEAAADGAAAAQQSVAEAAADSDCGDGGAAAAQQSVAEAAAAADSDCETDVENTVTHKGKGRGSATR